jgi:hypothetical protein
MLSATRFRIGGIAFLILASACIAAPAHAALPSSWGSGPVSPVPATTGAHFGQSVVNVDLDLDGKDEVVVGAPDFTDSTLGSGITGRVYVFHASGDPDPDRLWPAPISPPSPQPGNIPNSQPTRFGAELAVLGDVGRCLSTGDNCSVGATDGIPELLVSAPGTDTGATSGEDQGAVYVLDGDTGRILKQVQLSERPASGSAGFGKSVTGLAGQPPCFGAGGVGDCAYAADHDVAIGDVNGGGEADFVVGAPNFAESDLTREDICTGVCPDVGRAYVFFGEALNGSSTTPMTEDGNSTTIFYPGALATGDKPLFGTAVAPLGDVGRCTDAAPAPGDPVCAKPPVSLTSQPDGRPDFAATAPGLDLAGAADAGVAYLMDAAGNAAMVQIDGPDPAAGRSFGTVLHGSLAVGNLGSGAAPDLVVGSPGAGRALAFDGAPTGPALIANVTGDGGFGEAVAALGDIAADTPGEFAIGAPGAGAVHIASACGGGVLRTLNDPDGGPGAGFGTAIAPLGDLNGDGFIDLAVGAPGASAGEGRVYTFISTPPASAFAGCGGPVGPDEPGTSGTAGTGGQKKATPPPKVTARVLRRLALVPSKRRLSRGRSLKLRGSLRASAGQAACQSRQKIAIQRRKLTGGRYQTFDVAITKKTGRFLAGTRPSRSYLYRARVSQTSRCRGATSKVAKVVVRKR